MQADVFTPVEQRTLDPDFTGGTHLGDQVPRRPGRIPPSLEEYREQQARRDGVPMGETRGYGSTGYGSIDQASTPGQHGTGYGGYGSNVLTSSYGPTSFAAGYNTGTAASTGFGPAGMSQSTTGMSYGSGAQTNPQGQYGYGSTGGYNTMPPQQGGTSYSARQGSQHNPTTYDTPMTGTFDAPQDHSQGRRRTKSSSPSGPKKKSKK